MARLEQFNPGKYSYLTSLMARVMRNVISTQNFGVEIPSGVKEEVCFVLALLGRKKSAVKKVGLITENSASSFGWEMYRSIFGSLNGTSYKIADKRIRNWYKSVLKFCEKIGTAEPLNAKELVIASDLKLFWILLGQKAENAIQMDRYYDSLDDE